MRRLESQEGSLLSRFMKPMFKAPDPVLTIQDLEDAFIRMAECCAPLMGDPIVGVQDERGITIHRTQCPRLEGARSESLINVGWELDNRKRPYRFSIRIKQDRPGMLYKVSKVMRDLNVNIVDIGLVRDTRHGESDIHVRVEPIPVKTFRQIVSRLRDIKEVRRISTLPLPTGNAS